MGERQRCGFRVLTNPHLHSRLPSVLFLDLHPLDWRSTPPNPSTVSVATLLAHYLAVYQVPLPVSGKIRTVWVRNTNDKTTQTVLTFSNRVVICQGDQQGAPEAYSS